MQPQDILAAEGTVPLTEMGDAEYCGEPEQAERYFEIRRQLLDALRK